MNKSDKPQRKQPLHTRLRNVPGVWRHCFSIGNGLEVKSEKWYNLFCDIAF